MGPIFPILPYESRVDCLRLFEASEGLGAYVKKNKSVR
jgi:hypothetical protein